MWFLSETHSLLWTWDQFLVKYTVNTHETSCSVLFLHVTGSFSAVNHYQPKKWPPGTSFPISPSREYRITWPCHMPSWSHTPVSFFPVTQCLEVLRILCFSPLSFCSHISCSFYESCFAHVPLVDRFMLNKWITWKGKQVHYVWCDLKSHRWISEFRSLTSYWSNWS